MPVIISPLQSLLFRKAALVAALDLVMNDLRAPHIAPAEAHLAKPSPKPSSANAQPTTP